LQAQQQMHVIFHSTHRLRHSAQAARGATEIFMETRTPIRTNDWTPFFGAEYDVVVETVKGRAHGLFEARIGYGAKDRQGGREVFWHPSGVREPLGRVRRSTLRCDLRLLSGNPPGWPRGPADGIQTTATFTQLIGGNASKRQSHCSPPSRPIQS